MKPRIVIIGGGFAGLEAAKALKNSECEILLFDKRNYTLFQPLLYQVATAALSPSAIAAPIRQVLAKQDNVQVFMANVTDINLEKKAILVEDQWVRFDYLILASGAKTNYFGNSWTNNAPGLKTIEEALHIRSRFLIAFEQAEVEVDMKAQKAALTFTVVGAGPTGVELAGAIAEMCHKTLKSDFRSIDTSTARVILIDAGDRVLAGFHDHSSQKALEQLKKLGVEVLLNARVIKVKNTAIEIEQGAKKTIILSNNIIWAAGVTPSSLTQKLKIKLHRSGRVPVRGDLSIASDRNVFAVGDLSYYEDPKTQAPVPGVAQGAIQMGRFVGDTIAKEIKAKNNNMPPLQRKTFRYHDRGAMAIIGRSKAVADIYGMRFSGFFAFLTWAFIHILFLIGFRRKLTTLAEWLWLYFFHDRGVRLVTADDARLKVTKPQQDPRLVSVDAMRNS